ncbi:GIY-YIG nuclease family protein [Lactococcus petauri]|uniref:GIY-YIG nuclease family protein n=1 Tax=Lactococcus petauri TaxID=1940789 RepID=UPI0023EBA3C2|nr:GIY-YIG nuclease family protein [Lactococcus petauri]
MNIFKKLKQLTTLNKDIEEKNRYLVKLKLQLNSIEIKLEDNQKLIDDQELLIRKVSEEFAQKNENLRLEIINSANKDSENIRKEAETYVSNLTEQYHQTIKENETLIEENTKLLKENNRLKTQGRKFRSELQLIKTLHKEYPYYDNEAIYENIKEVYAKDGLLDTVSNLHLHSEDSKELRKLSRATSKEITNVLKKYEKNYTTKSNMTIYSLMIIGLQSEIKILMYNLSFNKLSDSKDKLKEIINKFLIIAGDGNQTILPTITKFLLEIEPLYKELLDIEYKYFIYREREKEEQRQLKEQMKQEAEERKAMEAEKKKLSLEESKYKTEIEKNSQLLENETDTNKIEQLRIRILELQNQLSSVETKKEEIAKLSLGKAGYVYIISNLGSFGENIFKIGMTRRLEPQQRIDELGSASVPFKFDVHAFVFSDDAVGLENKLHRMLTNNRVNKVNLRKEFFKVDINQIESIIEEIDPTASFNKTILAQEYNQSLAMMENAIA